MNIQPITPPLREGQTCQCRVCGQWRATVADLDGPAFKAFYCEDCRPDQLTTLDETERARRERAGLGIRIPCERCAGAAVVSANYQRGRAELRAAQWTEIENGWVCPTHRRKDTTQ